MDEVKCDKCGRHYGVRAGQTVPLLPPGRNAMAALLTGWTRDESGAWDCGCKP